MYICRHYNIFIINFMRNRFFGMLATIMMGGAVMTGLTACSNTDNNDGNDQQKRVALLLPDNSRINRWGTDLKNLEDAMATYGIKTTSYVAPETAEGADEQVEQLKKAINDGEEVSVRPVIGTKAGSPYTVAELEKTIFLQLCARMTSQSTSVVIRLFW